MMILPFKRSYSTYKKNQCTRDTSLYNVEQLQGNADYMPHIPPVLNCIAQTEVNRQVPITSLLHCMHDIKIAI